MHAAIALMMGIPVRRISLELEQYNGNLTVKGVQLAPFFMDTEDAQWRLLMFYYGPAIFEREVLRVPEEEVRTGALVDEQEANKVLDAAVASGRDREKVRSQTVRDVREVMSWANLQQVYNQVVKKLYEQNLVNMETLYGEFERVLGRSGLRANQHIKKLIAERLVSTQMSTCSCIRPHQTAVA